MIRPLSLVSFAMLAAGPAFAGGIDIRLGDEAAQFEYLFDSDSQIGIGGADVGTGVFFNENDDIALHFGALVTGSSVGRNRALQLGAGAKAYAAELDCDGAPPGQQCGQQDSISAVAVGGRISYIFPSRMPMALTGELFYAPNITSFGDNEDLSDAQIRFEVELAPATRFYVGYRVFETELEDSPIDYELDDSAHAGVRFTF